MLIDKHVTREEVREASVVTEEEKRKNLAQQMLLKKKRELDVVLCKIARKNQDDYKESVNTDIDALRERKQELEEEVEELEQSV